MPEPVLKARQTWIDRHPDWEFRIWRLEDLTWLRNQSLFDRAVPYSQKADFARYESCIDSVASTSTRTWSVSGRWIRCSTGAASSPGASPVACGGRHLRSDTVSSDRAGGDRAPPRVLLHPSERSAQCDHGTHLLDRTIRDGGWESRPDPIFPPPTSIPTLGGAMAPREEFVRAYAVHHWGHSWKGQRGVEREARGSSPSAKGGAVPSSARALWRESERQCGHANGLAKSSAEEHPLMRLPPITDSEAPAVPSRCQRQRSTGSHGDLASPRGDALSDAHCYVPPTTSPSRQSSR